MYDVKEMAIGEFYIYELSDNNSNSWIKVAPERGGIILSLGIKGEEILFLNEETFINKNSNIRGGVPILFPICGQLINDEYELNGQVYKMNNHGIARNHPWKVVNISLEEELSISLSFESNEETKKSYPFEFQLIFKYVLSEKGLSIHQEYINKSGTDMPLHPGFHPYFKTSSKVLDFETDAKKYLDYNDMEIKNFDGRLGLNNKKEALVFLDAKENRITFPLNELNKKVTLEYDSIFRYIVVWTEQNQNFICVEPWVAKKNGFNNKNELLYIKPGESLSSIISIFVEP